MESWKDWFQPHILERGRACFEEGRVSQLERTEDGYSAIVKGTEEYEVEILLKGTAIEDMLCDCPYAEQGNACKHMAAVLFAAAAGQPEKNASAKKESLTPLGLVEKIPDSQLRPLLTELVSADEKLYRDLRLQYGEMSLEECVKTLKEELTSIGGLYADRHGYINDRDAVDFESDIAEHIRRQSQMLLERKKPLLALQAGMEALREFASYDAEEICGFVDDAMDTMLTDVLCACGEEDASKAFDLLRLCAESASEHWQIRDFAEQAIFSQFPGEAFDRKRLALVDRQIANHEISGMRNYSDKYEMRQLLVRRFDLMKALSFSKEEMDAFLARYTSYPDIRILRVQQAQNEGNLDEAVRLLREGKSADCDSPGLVAQYSARLMDLYEQQGKQDELLAELEYHVFTLSSGGMEMLDRLKKTCTPMQWIGYRERYLSGRNRHRLELMESEGLWDRLMEAVAAAKQLSVLDRYESALKQRYPDAVLEAYVNTLEKEAAEVSGRKRYQELANYLKKLVRYPGGEGRIAQLTQDWRLRYRRRRAMMEELAEAGF